MIVTTKFIGPTDHHGSRITAFAGADKRGLQVVWAHELSAEQNHQAAAVNRWTSSHPGERVKSIKSYTLPDASNHAMVHIINR